MIIGLTGGIASGKTACSRWFASQGIPIIDADITAREVVEVGKPALAALTQAFGTDILQQDGSLNRPALREIIFRDPAAKAAAENILHPAIAAATQTALQALSSHSIIIRAVPLLFENSIDKQCTAVISVDVPRSLQLARGAARDGQTEADIARIIDAQVSRAHRLAHSHFIIDNSASLESAYAQCATVLQTLRVLAE